LIDEACARLPHNLPQTEWRQYLSDEPYHKTCANLPVGLDDARNLARAGKIDEAIALFRQAKGLDPSLTLDPTSEARRLAAALMKEGKALAADNKEEAAFAAFSKAKELDPGLAIEPRAKAAMRAEESDSHKSQIQFREVKDAYLRLVSQADNTGQQNVAEKGFANDERRAREEQLLIVLSAFAQTQQWDTTSTILADDWNEICWAGTLAGQAAAVLNLCQHAVDLAPDNGEIRDSRGVARALTGDTNGAIDDFVFILEDLKKKEQTDLLKGQKQQRTEWITALKAGKNPFDADLLRKLRAQ
jgi:tetratricopeptide (TPR) repeat protein